MNPATREKIEAIIRETGFQPNANAKFLKQTISSTITVIVKGIQNSFFETILEEMQEVFKENGEEVSVIFLDETENEVDAAEHACSTRKPRGLIFLGGNIQEFRKNFDRITVPSVLVTVDASQLGYDNLSSFTTDDIPGAKEAVSYLVRFGHSRIGIVGGSLDETSGQLSTSRLAGAREILDAHRIPFTFENNYAPCRFSMDDGYRATRELLQKNPEITAIFAMSDLIAVGAVRAVRDMEKNVPEDVSVIGYDGIDYVNYSVPRIATIRQNTGVSFTDLLKQIRMSRATEYLLNTDLPVFEIAEIVGYHSADHFSRVFRSQFRCSPQEYRRTHVKSGERFIPFEKQP